MSVRDCRLRSEEGTIDLGWKNLEMIFKLGLEGRVRTDRWNQQSKSSGAEEAARAVRVRGALL